MKTLFDKVKPEDKVQGKTTKQIYEVWVVDPDAKDGEDAIALLLHGKLCYYTKAQFNYHFRKVKNAS